jgi:hypothetical protein
MIRSLLAIVAGYCVMAVSVRVLFTLGFGGLEDSGSLLAKLLYGTVFAALAGYVVALIARRFEIAHAAVLAAIMLLLGVISILLSVEPLWYRITDAAMEVLAILLGGYARVWQVRKARG